MFKKEHPIYDVEITKERVDTGKPGAPFYANISEHKRIRLFGILIKRVRITGDFPKSKQ